jgi:hypothetical protein
MKTHANPLNIPTLIASSFACIQAPVVEKATLKEKELKVYSSRKM